ncbi:hypothetical protein SCP_1103790 [Sparassis crispa]|uniref:Uncharacterized protein n=1 Tax=Sparassis crispa TaxID=139825 RepID=A0A401GZX5_9APHY|nr:hypothetical protein SCP_1103790 [Sparassis crispa]GBE87702.1 hypothetical protein SCP_1103790 [Sparassis crispa]
MLIYVPSNPRCFSDARSLRIQMLSRVGHNRSAFCSSVPSPAPPFNAKVIVALVWEQISPSNSLFQFNNKRQLVL